MSQTYYTILTKLGAELLANATSLGIPLKLTSMAVGDGNGSVPKPIATQTSLIHEVRRAAINSLSVDKNNPNQIIAEQVIPENEGGWFIHEIGLFDDKGNLIAVGNCPPTYKPQLAEGSGRTQVIRMIIVIDNVEAVALKIDPSVVLATREYVDNQIKDHEQTTNHPDATTKSKGFVKLSSAIDSQSETEAATPLAIKKVNDELIKITDKFQYDESESRVFSPDKLMHFVIRNDGISGIYSNTIKGFLWSINKKGEINGKIAAGNVTGLEAMIPKAITLSSAIDSQSETEAATPLAIKKVNDELIKITDKFQYDESESRVFSPDKLMHFVIRNDGISGIYSNVAKGFLWSINKAGEINGKILAKNVIDLSDSVSNMFTNNITDLAGFARLPNGLILQWGLVDYYATTGIKGTLQSFYTSFPSKCLSITVSDYGDGANSVSANPVTPSQFVCWAKTLNGRYENSKLHYIAIGI